MSTHPRAPSAFLLALLAMSTIACGDTDTNAPTTNLSGTFLLRAIDATPLPVTLTGARIPTQFVVIADTLRLDESGTFEQRSIVPGQQTQSITGNFAVRGDSIFLLERITGALAAHGITAGDSLHLRSLTAHYFPNHDWAYTRAR